LKKIAPQGRGRREDNTVHYKKAGKIFMKGNVTAIETCGGLTLAGRHVPTKATLSLLSSARQERANTTRGLWVEIRTERSLTNYYHG